MLKVGIMISVKLAGYVSDDKNVDLRPYIVVWPKRVKMHAPENSCTKFSLSK
jgi:hypothetical protein